jgi:hypothetical protein
MPRAPLLVGADSLVSPISDVRQAGTVSGAALMRGKRGPDR